jgi:hypothetical protein
VLASSAGSALGASRLSPSRVDVCLCESALRCPNGTTSPFRSASIYDCQKSGNEVLRRLVPFAADFPHFSDAPFGPDDNKVLRDLFVDLGGLPFTRILAGQQRVPRAAAAPAAAVQAAAAPAATAPAAASPNGLAHPPSFPSLRPGAPSPAPLPCPAPALRPRTPPSDLRPLPPRAAGWS